MDRLWRVLKAFAIGLGYAILAELVVRPLVSIIPVGWSANLLSAATTPVWIIAVSLLIVVAYLFWPTITSWFPHAKKSGSETPAEKAFRSLPEPKSLRQQTFDLVTAMKKCLIEYHGSLDANAVVATEISRAFNDCLRAIRDKVVRFTGADRARFSLPLPTVSNMARFLTELERTAGQLKDDIPPAP
jgi:hypothetical protein